MTNTKLPQRVTEQEEMQNRESECARRDKDPLMSLVFPTLGPSLSSSGVKLLGKKAGVNFSDWTSATSNPSLQESHHILIF